MRRPERAAFLILVLSGLSFPAEIIKLFSDPKTVGVSKDASSPYEVGETVCFEREKATIGCGKVSKIFKYGAAVELDGQDLQPRVGDQVIGRKPASVPLAPETEPRSVDLTPLKKNGLIGRFSFGLNYPDYSTTSSSYTKQFSYLVGIGTEIPLNSALSLEPSLIYSPEWVSSVQSTVTSRVSVVYLEIPIYLKVKPFYRTVTKITPYFLIGPSYGYLLSATLKYEGLDTPDTDFTPLLNSSRFSVNAAIGFDTDISDSMNLGFSVRYLLSLGSPARSTSGSSAKLFQAVFALGWDYEQDVFND